MHRLVLEWVEEGRNRSQAFSFDSSAERPVRIGRDESKCDVVLRDATKTVSGLHVEIFFNSLTSTFYLRNLTSKRDRPNPAWVDGQKIIEQEIPLKPITTIQVGKMRLRVNISSTSGGNKLAHGLKCHVCNHISSQDRLSLVCPWCGTSLASAETTVYFPDESS